MSATAELPEHATAPRDTPLAALHRALDGRMVGFAGWRLPVQYPTGVIAEHVQCRTRAALFDVSHMGQLELQGAEAASFLERLVPSELLALPVGRQRYTVLLNEAGGIVDDLLVTRLAPDRLFLVVNAARTDVDTALLERALPPDVRLVRHADRALLALQGPAAAGVLASVLPGAETLPFLGAAFHDAALVARCGYTGEDGFEISLPAEAAETFARRLLESPAVAPAGLGARDTLRLEAGLPLWGADIDELTSPVEAGLAFTIGRRRRAEGGFPGAVAILDQLARGPHRVRVGLRPEGRQPARAATAIAAGDGTAAGTVTSGGFGPTVGGPVSMAYVRRGLAAAGTRLRLDLRGRPVGAVVAPLPFVPHRTLRAPTPHP